MFNESKSILIVMLIAILSKLLGFGREIALASKFGATVFTDAYLLATTITLVIFSGIGAALSTTFVPLYTNLAERENSKAALRFANNILNLVVLFTVGFSLLCLLFINPLVKIFAAGLQGEALKLTAEFTRLLLPGIVITGVNQILIGYLYANKKFEPPVLAGLPYNIILIISIAIGSVWNKKLLIYGTLGAVLSQLFFQYYWACKTGYVFKLGVNFKDKNVKTLFTLVTPVFFGMAVKQLNIVIDKRLASTLAAGSISALNFADRLNTFVLSVFVSSVSTVMYPGLAQFAARRDNNGFKDYLIKYANLMILLIIPISVGAMCLAAPIVRILFQRGSFDFRAAGMTSGALYYYSLGMVGFGLRDILTQAFYARQNTRIPMLSGAVTVGANIGLNLILIKPMGHRGLALATSISALLGTLILFAQLKQTVDSFKGKKIIIVTIKSGLASALMGLAVKLLSKPIFLFLGQGFISEALGLLLIVSLGGLIYLGLILVMQVEEAGLILKAAKKSCFLFVKRISQLKSFMRS